MATIFATDFEGYADGDLSLPANGWNAGVGDTDVVSHDAHSGTKCVYLEGGALQRNTGYFGRNVTMEMWARTVTPNPVFDGGPSLQIANEDGDQTPIIMTALENSTDLHLFLFDALVGSAANVVIPNTYQKYKLVSRFSTVNGSGDDVNADGCVSCYVDDALVISVSDVRVAVSSVGWDSFLNTYEVCYFDVDGYIDDVSILDDEVTCGATVPPVVPPNDSTPCCGSGPTPDNPNPSSTPNPGNPRTPLQPWTPQCAGGGDVLFASDVTDLESWAL